jgi:DNA-binding CsgD family transcriptional regulator/tetratricopeptide (TPR) repeat protein
VVQPRVLTVAVLAAHGGGSWDTGSGAVVSHDRRRAVLVFDAVSDAVAGARRAAHAGAAVGLAAGEVSTGGDWWAGPALDAAEALADRAGAGRVLATTTVPALMPRNGERWVAAGASDVPGGGRVEMVELAVDGAPDGGALAVPLPRLLAIAAPFPFVPRPESWAVLERAWAAGATGGRQVVLLGGAAGTGKTRLVSEFARHVQAQGGVVLYGGCSDRLAAPYQPFAEAVGHLVRSLDPGAVAELVVPHATELMRLAPGLAGTLGASHADVAVDPETVRYRLFGAMSSLLSAVSARRPVLLVLDDLQWAGRPTVQMLDHLSRDSSLARVVIVGAYRSVPTEVGEALREALPDLRRQPGAVRIGLPEFDREGIGRFVAGVTGAEGDSGLDGVADVLAEQTGGNAFLMGELWRHLVDAGYLADGRGGWRVLRPLDDVASPEGVREVVDLRLGGLPDETRRVLEVAAVAGTEFSAAVVAEASGSDHRHVLDALDPAVRSGLVEEAGAGEHRFAHALVRRSVVDNLGPSARRGHHLDVGRALERRGDRSVSEIAHHLTAAVPLVDAGEVVDVARRAAVEATGAVAFDDAARHLEATLPLVDAGRSRCELLLELADARMRAGDVAAALERCLECGALATEIGEPSLVVAAALAYDDANWRAALHGGVAEQLLRHALPLAPDGATEVHVQAALSRALAFTGRSDEARNLGDRALAAARDLGDHSAIRVAMSSVLFTPWTAETIDHQVAIARELLDRAAAAGDIEWQAGALSKLLYGLITLGELDEARDIAHTFREWTDRSGQPLFGVLAFQAWGLLAMGEGRFAEAETLADEANVLSTFLSGTDAEGGYGVQLFTLRREQGRLDEARPLVEAVARLGQEGATWRPALAVLYAELGRLDDAARELRHLVADDLRAVPRDSLYCGSLSYLADAAVAVGDRDAAEPIYRELSPYRHLVVQVGYHLAAYGAADRYLGELAALQGRVRDAESHFEAALRLDQRAHMPVWSAHSQLAYGRFLLGRGRAGDRERARALLTSAAETARSLGMARVAEVADAVLGDAAGPSRPVSVVGAGGAVGVDGAGRASGPGRSGGYDGPGGAAPEVGMTARELGVLRLLVDGHSNREIGERLHISQHTAANHVRRILLKSGCANRTEAASWALRRGLVSE